MNWQEEYLKRKSYFKDYYQKRRQSRKVMSQSWGGPMEWQQHESLNPIHIISLGAGVQSSTMALMAAAGEIHPMPKAAIFADTQAEPKVVYEWLDWLESKLLFPIYRVTAGSLTDVSLRKHTNTTTGQPYVRNLVPAFVKKHDGSIGLAGRSCTFDHKIKPILKKCRQIADVKMRNKSVRVINWIGISEDEADRMKPSLEIWAKSRWPLIEKGMTRQMCLQWMKDRGFPEPPRSACVYCPFHSDAEWRRIKDGQPEEFKRAVEFERSIQLLHSDQSLPNRLTGVPFLHKSCKPIDQVVFQNNESKGSSLWGNECEGMCGV